MSGVLLSYRRSDSAASTGRLRDRLVAEFGADQVFLDVDDVVPGSDFRVLIDREIARCEVVCVVIGSSWISARNEEGLRLFQSGDPVFAEVTRALEANVNTIPVLVDGATFPHEGDLPEELRPLCRLSAVTLREETYDEDVTELLATVKSYLEFDARGRSRVRKLWNEASWVRRGAAGLVGLLGTIMLFVGIWDRFGPTEAPEVRMSGDLNVAVAEFGLVKDDGSVETTGETEAFAQSTYHVLDSELSALPGIHFDVLPPELTGSLPGETPEERSLSASKIGDETGADVVVYGLVDASPGRTEIRPEFYIVDPELVTDAEELIGHYQLGGGITTSADLSSNPVAREELRSELVQRADGLLRVILGISYFGLEKYGEASDVFADIIESGAVNEADGLEIVYLFEGNAAARAGDLERAETAYLSALGVNKGFARAQVGLAAVTFQEAHNGCLPERIDAEGVRDAIDRYQQALDASDQPAGANIDAKVAFGVGRARLCLGLAGIEEAWAEAEASYRAVIEAYEAGELRSTELAAEAWSGLGLVKLNAEPIGDKALREAVADFEAAVSLSAHPDRQAVWHGFQGFALCRLGETADSVEAYDRAIALTSDPVARRELQDARDRSATGTGDDC